MGNCCYYLFCCCCCDQKDLKEVNFSKKEQNLRTLRKITKTDLRTMSSGIDPSTSPILEHIVIYEIPQKNFQTEIDLLRYLGYEQIAYIDKGKFGIVHKLREQKTGLELACKIVDLGQIEHNNRWVDMKNELYTLQRTKHPNLVKMVSNFIIESKITKQKSFYIIMEFAKNGTLETYLLKYGPFDERQCKTWFAQMLSAMIFMHNKGIAHRDLKLQNILLDINTDVLISDFGMSRVLFRPRDGGLIDSKTYGGTVPYMAPELLIKRGESSEDIQNKKYNSFLVDVWAMGVILFRLFTQYYPFNTENTLKAVKDMNERKWRRHPFLREYRPSRGLHDILFDLLEPEPSNRPALSQIRSHNWIRKTYEQVERVNTKLMEQVI